MDSKKLLIISNRVISTTDNNGKTLYSFIESLPKESVSQLYFYGNPPVITGYDYFQLSDRDIILGQFNKRLRGRKIEAVENKSQSGNISNTTDFTIQTKYRIPRNDIFLLLRELMWKNSWKSKQLDEWLDAVKPDAVFFMAGDCLYAYRICAYVVNRFHCRLNVYVTDDYVLPRRNENIWSKYRRKRIKTAMDKCVRYSDVFFTISEQMRITYKKMFNRDSSIIFNLSESLQDKEICEKAWENKTIIFTYAGSLYYGRDQVLWKLAKAIECYNIKHPESKKAQLNIYTNVNPDFRWLIKIRNIDCVKYLGSLNKKQLKEQLNLSNVLVFVESFEPEQIEKTRLSFSTKVPEYLSVGKPILAIGPGKVGSMEYLRDAALCVYNEDDLYKNLEKLILSDKEKKEYSKKALEKYCNSCCGFSNTLKLLDIG